MLYTDIPTIPFHPVAADNEQSQRCRSIYHHPTVLQASLRHAFKHALPSLSHISHTTNLYTMAGLPQTTTSPIAYDSSSFHTDAAGIPTRGPTTLSAPARTRTWVSPLSILRYEAVIQPPWLLIIRGMQLFLAWVVIGMLATTLVFNDFPGFHPPLVALLFAACFTVFPVSLQTTPCIPLQLRIDARTILLMDVLATLLWGTTLAAFASAVRATNYQYWGGVNWLDPRPFATGPNPTDARIAWRCALAAIYIGGAEFFLFLITTLVFAYHYHLALITLTTRVPGDIEATATAPLNSVPVTKEPLVDGDRLTVQHGAPHANGAAGEKVFLGTHPVEPTQV
ncbi:hypothetical protein EJ08DRAFT_386785 [Tothia fuscella]|uniref:MARVEL domain-containing protein n=1 Tax=Tothia fuscella TaxID=1048955 RepID=A0A9P4P0G6_9PEZI|nr:hypothetical protein EJ08DRAFT_386785 [Tothia fuscella]